MTLGVFLAVLAAALLHATWNALIKLGQSKVTTMFIMTVTQGAGSLFLAVWAGLPASEVWFWLIASGVFHAAYKIFLTFAYEQGDLSRVYPIARGTAPMIVLVVSALFLADTLGTFEIVGVIILGIGIVLMGRGALISGESRKLMPFALLSALSTAGYSIVDGMGARIAGDAVLFVSWMFFLDALIFTPVIFTLRGTHIAIAPPKAWALGALAAAASVGAYMIAVWAMTVAPIALVAALRETSILFAVLIGWLVFGEKMDRLKAGAAAIIVAGVAATRL